MTQTMTAAEYREQIASDHAGVWRKTRKYRNKPTTSGGEKFDSRKEWRRHVILRLDEEAGTIEQLERQVPFKMIVSGHLICTLIIDWTYIEKGQVVAEDCKSPATAKERSFRIKFKLAQALYPQITWRLS